MVIFSIIIFSFESASDSDTFVLLKDLLLMHDVIYVISVKTHFLITQK